MLPNDFFAKPITTELTWDDLDLPRDTLSRIHEIEKWIKNSNSLLKKWDMTKRLKSGYRALFYGTSEKQKTLTASLLGRYTNKDVYRIDLSLVVSKYIGETEKNLSALFDRAKNKDWILFFDEADALFGKRTGVKDAHDKYANQEVSYLLQRMEEYAGLAILATNTKEDIDEAFLRRFNSIIRFD